MTLPISTQITNLKAKAHKLGISSSAVKDIENSNDTPKAIVAGIKQLIADAKPSTSKVTVKDVADAIKRGELDPRSSETASLLADATNDESEVPPPSPNDDTAKSKGQKKGKKSRGSSPAKQDRQVKTPPENRSFDSKSAIVVMLKGTRADQMDVKNTTLNAIRAVHQNGTAKASIDDVREVLKKHRIDMDDTKLRMSIGNLARDSRIARLGHGVYKAL